MQRYVTNAANLQTIGPTMKLTDIFRAKAQSPVETKESQTAATIVMSPGQAAWSVDTNAKAYASEAYQKNVVAYRAVSAVAEAVASVPWTAWRGDVEVTQSPLLDLIAQPNSGMSGREYMEAKVSYLMISGSAYEEQVTATGNLPRELYVHRPDRMTVVPGSRGVPIAYVYDINGRKTRWDVDPDTQKSAIMHTKLFNPLDDWYGQSPARAGSFAIDQHNESMTWMQSLLQNSARPSGALVMKDGETLSDENYNRLKTMIEDQYQGAQNGGRPMLLEGGMEWQGMGLSPTDMSIIETKYSAARDVALAWGVPPQLLGIPGDNTYANYAEARLAFWEDTILPLLDKLAQDWTNWLGEPFGLELRPDLDQIPAIVDKRKTLWTMLDASPSLTTNEKREAMGYEPIEGGDVLQAPKQDAGFGGIDAKTAAMIAGYEFK